MRKPLLHVERLAKRVLRCDEGVVAIEFGAVASVLILMAVGATDVGFAMRHRGQMESAVRAGVQKAMEGGTTDAVQSAVLASTDLPTDPAPTATATKKCYDSGGAEATCGSASAKSIYMEITLTQSHKWILGLPGWANPANLTLTRTVRIG